ncbi:MAG: UbiA family prenyltransferase [Promethearchaeota archaeon]
MIRKALLFRNLVDNIPKNIGLYSVGILFLVMFGYTFDVLATVLGLIAFIISYSSIYIINDLFDIAEDKGIPEKHMRKPLTQGLVEKSEAVTISLVLLLVGLSLSFILNFMFFGFLSTLILVNALYSVPIASLSARQTISDGSRQQNQEYDYGRPTSFKHSILGLPLVLVMQFLKMLLPWTITTQLAQFPFLFALGFSLVYVVLFKGYKKNQTVGESVVRELLLFGLATIVFILSMLIHPKPIFQASIVLYLVAGMALFRNFRLIDKRVIILSPVYIGLGLVFLIILIHIETMT